MSHNMKQFLSNTNIAFQIIIIFIILQHVILDILSRSELGDEYRTQIKNPMQVKCKVSRSKSVPTPSP